MSGKKKGTDISSTEPDDAPELDDTFFERADEYEGERLIRRGRPPGSDNKVSTTVRFDADILAAFRAEGPGWQTRMNQALREWLQMQRPG